MADFYCVEPCNHCAPSSDIWL